MDEPTLPWTVDGKAATALRITPNELRGPGYVRVRHGVRVPIGVDVTDPDIRIAAVSGQLPPHAVLGGWAAARLHEAATDPDGPRVFDGGPRWDRRATDAGARVLVCAAPDSRLTTRADVRILRSAVARHERTQVGAAPVTTPLRTAFDLVRLLPREAAVIAADRLLALGLLDEDELRMRIEMARGWVGRPRAAAVLPLLDGAAESPQESVLRLLWLDAGFPKPAGNVDVLDARGRFVGRVDLLDEEAGVAAEYDGAVHASSDRRGSDHRRHEALEHLGLTMVRATAVDVGSASARHAWQRRLHRAYASVRRSPRPCSWTTKPPRTGASSW
ncbi:hypothetical protein ICW40_06725 [Actinotalea ferrariae]|uniref:endonuclease domain-containing protein n=1 Tax=Actinotalea ferrariae TaxID=1386098 RepID=UPI001C8C5F98|nr:endonuclease domain-containing protein [Actinotalea ferrariae]MBX9244500.1 hypothetical protein [Actinotalea ferrariae]